MAEIFDVAGGSLQAEDGPDDSLDKLGLGLGLNWLPTLPELGARPILAARWEGAGVPAHAGVAPKRWPARNTSPWESQPEGYVAGNGAGTLRC